MTTKLTIDQADALDDALRDVGVNPDVVLKARSRGDLVLHCAASDYGRLMVDLAVGLEGVREPNPALAELLANSTETEVTGGEVVFRFPDLRHPRLA